ncbi:MAG: helicase-related protein [Bacteroidota bacterium]
MEYKAGSLVRARSREWVVQPSPDPELVILKPLGGSDDEITGIYLPLKIEDDKITSADFPKPEVDDLGDFASAKLLYDAARLSFRSGAGPFRSMGKLSFRPRSYQMVPLIMALRQEVIRLLIADDVGIGKTPESLLIAKEMLERKEVSRFAVICPPHLCNQWQNEILEKFGLEAVIIRSNTQARLDREIQGDVSVFSYYPYQVISIDYIKSDTRRNVFINECPELCIIDEIHTCAKPEGANKNQHQRYSLIHDLSRKGGQHLIMLTATPHSGKAEEFKSLLGLIKNEFLNLDLTAASPEQRKELAKHFVQRKRADVQEWMGEKTLFPERDAGEFAYALTPSYAAFYNQLLDFARELAIPSKEQKGVRQQMRYWTALALMRGCMSSPMAGLEMLDRRLQNKQLDEGEENELGTNPVMDNDQGTDPDNTPSHLIEKSVWADNEVKQIKSLKTQLERLGNFKDDLKVKNAGDIVADWLKENHNPVIFCRYIATAHYVGALLTEHLLKIYKKDIDIRVITSEDPDEVRKERVDEMKKSSRRVLIATDCLSEGINLQHLFTAVLHYDLPWNPNRLEQREGRVDRFGQKREIVKAYLLYGKDNPIDGVVLKVLLRKVREIKRSLKISMPFPENSETIMDAVLQTVLLNPKKIQESLQVTLDFGPDSAITQSELKATKAIEDAAEREKRSRDLFAQYAIKASEIEEDLHHVDEAIGHPKDVEHFVIGCMAYLGVQMDSYNLGYRLYPANLTESLKATLPEGSPLAVTFFSPTPENVYYIGRNHPFVEQLCQVMLAAALDHSERLKIARASLIKTTFVSIKTTLILFRVRNVIGDKTGSNELVAEEMLLWGFKGSPQDGNFLTNIEARALLNEAGPTGDTTPEQRRSGLTQEREVIDALKKEFDKVAHDRAENLVGSHERFRKVMGGNKYKVVLPILPMDVMGLYVLLPDNRNQSRA